MSKIIIVGAGHVGTALAHSLIVRGLGDEIGIIDLREEKLYGEVLDLQHSLPHTANPEQKVFAANYQDTKDADIIVVALESQKAQFGDTADRLNLLTINKEESVKVAQQAKDAGFNGIYIVITNPVDIISRIIQEVSGLPTNQVFGTGTLLETARLKSILSGKFNVPINSVDGYVLGEHGHSAFGAWSTVTIDGQEITKTNPNLDWEELDQEIIQAAYEVYYSKKETSYGIANVAARLIWAVLNDEGVTLPVSAYLNGEYGLKDIYIGVLATIGKNGVQKVWQLPLLDKEQNKLEISAQVLQRHYENAKGASNNEQNIQSKSISTGEYSS